jgi:hypothetical protein
VEEGHVCDPRTLNQVIAHEYPNVDPATALRHAI